MNQRINIIGLSLLELQERLVEHGFEKYRAAQIWGWLYKKGAHDFSVMSSIAKPQQAKLAELFSLERPEISKNLTSFDNTR
ncbi:MAG: 23S rRNA (adenine(2503)-C(2))-methyltransferase RlmN, partial [Alphaproteobacteria bacterium]